MLRRLSLGLFAVLTIFGCSGPSEPTAKAPVPGAKLEGKVDVAAFQGGYGIDFYQQAAKEFQANHPDLKITVEGNPRIWEQLRPRFIAGSPPDLTLPGWGMDHWALAEEGQLTDLGPALLTQTEDGKTWGETFEPALLKLGQLDGKQYTLPFYVSAFGWWYNPDVFAKNGWTPPKTFDEMLALSAKIKAKGISPITFQGKYPYYLLDGMLMPWAYSIGGAEAIRNAQNLEPGAWKSPAMLRAAEMIVELRDKGFFQPGAIGMSHTESQQEFLQGKAAMIPCGTWLESEMKNVMPKGAKLAFFPTPVVTGGKGDPTALLIGVEPWMVPSDAKNPQAGIELFKYMTSLPKAKEFVRQKGTLVAIKGGNEGEMPETLRGPAKAFTESKDQWAVQYRHWYPALNTEVENSLTAMLNGQLTPAQFCDRVEAAAEKTRADSTISKHKI